MERVLSAKLTAIVEWLDKNQPDVWQRGLWEAIQDAEKEVWEDNCDER